MTCITEDLNSIVKQLHTSFINNANNTGINFLVDGIALLYIAHQLKKTKELS